MSMAMLMKMHTPIKDGGRRQETSCHREALSQLSGVIVLASSAPSQHNLAIQGSSEH